VGAWRWLVAVHGGSEPVADQSSRLSAADPGGVRIRGDARVTTVALGVVRALDFLAIALLAGSLAFSRAAAAALDERMRSRVHTLTLGGLVLGAGTAATAAALESATRPQVVWALQAGLLAASLAAWPLRSRRTARLAVLSAYLIATPALSGHPWSRTPWAFIPSSLVHVGAASVWIGGLACVAAVLPLALRVGGPAQRTRVLAGVLGAFSPLALVCVGALAVTGVIQALLAVGSVHALANTTYGQLVLVKTGLLGLLAGLGAVNRERVLPTLRRLATAGGEPEGVGTLVRRTTAGELAALACVLAAAAALAAFTPPQASRVRVRQAPAASQPNSHSARITTASPAPIDTPLLSGS
jgi:putative copper resistance protein D